MALQISLCALAIISTILFIVVRVTKGGAWGILTKTLASFCFILYGVFSITQMTIFNMGTLFVLVGLVCGLIGDIILDLKYVYHNENDIYLNAGMLAFSVGHIFYFVGTILFTNGSIDMLLPILVSVGVALVLTPATIIGGKKMMGLDFGKFTWQSVGYSALLFFMTSLTIYLSCISIQFLVLGIGMALFLLSDLVLSLQYFGGKTEDKFLTIVNHALYYTAQILIATFLFMV